MADSGPDRSRSTRAARPREAGLAGVERALDILALFVKSDAANLGVTEIAAALDLSKTVVHRALTALKSRGFVEMDEQTHKYRLGWQFLAVGLTYLDRIDMRALGHETLSGLVSKTNETATLSVRVGWTRVYLDQVTPRRDIKMVVELGRPFPLHAGASSKAMLAFLPATERERYLAEEQLDALTRNTVTQRRRLRAELSRIREEGFAVSFGERDASAGSVAAPVFGRDDGLAGVLSVSGPLDRFREEVDAAAVAVVEAAGDLSRRLGKRADGSPAGR